MGVQQQRKKASRRGRGRQAAQEHPPEAQQHPPRPLEVNEQTRWKARVFLERPDHAPTTTDDRETDRDARLLLLLLNKLTPTKFEKHVSRFLSEETVHESENRLRDAVDTIVVRASEDARYSAMFAALCGRLANDLPPTPVPEGAEPAHPARSFADILVGVCRDELQRDVMAEQGCSSPHADDEAEEKEEREYREALARRRYVGHLRFVGELHNCGLVDLDTLTSFVESMLRMSGLSPTYGEGTIDELKLEGLCVLLMTCGPKLETAPVSTQMQRCWGALDLLLHEQDEQEERLSVRMRFMVLELMEFRDAGWQAKGRRKQLVAKTLDQIKDEAEKENVNKLGRKKKVRFRKKSEGGSN